MIGDKIRDLDFRVGSKLPTCRISQYTVKLSIMMPSTLEEESFCCIKKLVFNVCAGNGIEPAYSNDLLDSVSTPIVRIRISPKYTAKESLKPQTIGSHAFVSSFIDTIAFYTSGYLDFDMHI